MTAALRRVMRSVSFYPLSGAWVGGMAILALLAGGYIEIGIALMCETLLIALLMLGSLNHQIHLVHSLVNSQRTELLAFNQQLKDALKAAGVDVPEKADDAHRSEARSDQEDRETRGRG